MGRYGATSLRYLPAWSFQVNSKPIPVFKPIINKEAVFRQLAEVFDSGWLTLGPKTHQFEEQFAKFVGAQHAVALNSATAALHLSCLALDLNEGDEVIVPALTFVATGLAPLYCRATPVFADIEPDTLCIDPNDIERKITCRTKAIIPVHFAGHAALMDDILTIARRHNLAVIEDAAHATGGSYMGKSLGTLGASGCFSFQAVKNLTTGDGGMIVAEDGEIISRVRRLRWFGISKETWQRTDRAAYSWDYSVDELGFKFHMNDVTAAIGLAQLPEVQTHNESRRRVVEQYNAAFSNVGWITVPVEKPYTRSSWHAYVVKVPMRDELIRHLSLREITASVHYRPIHHYRVFAGINADLPVTEREWRKLVTLPLYPDMTNDDIGRVIDGVLSFGRHFGL
jgi:perosamine synthetase